MNLLLDTHIFLWWLAGSSALSPEALDRIMEADRAYVSAASLWEAAIKIGIGKLKADPAALVKGIRGSGFHPLPITPEHTLALSRLKVRHRDPFDRLLLAQAASEPLFLLTADRTLFSLSDLVVPA